MYLWQDQLLFPSYMAPKADGAVPRSVDVMTITTEAGAQVPAWFLAAPAVSAEHPGPAVLYFHGNGEIVDLQERVNALWWDLGVSLLIMEYRGYGRAGNAGKPSEAALVADGVKFFDQLIQRPDVDSKRVIIHGYSIGGGVAAQVAARRKPAVLVLESTFTSIADFAPRYGLPRWLAKNPFHTDEVLPGLNVPIFIAHGRPDTIVPVEHGRRLHALAPTSTYVELDCGHMNLPGYHAGDPYRDQLRQFLVQSGVLPTGTSTRIAP
jgi:fermentation-respiration switch protein FrsA (DUF1100 family)